MTLSRLSMKKVNNKRRHRSSSSAASITSLPKDLLVEVVASVASHSFIDLHNMKICCRDFLDAAEDKYVWKHVSLDKFPLIQWHPNGKELSFLKRCRESENIESLYKEGLREYFSYSNIGDNGLGSLKNVAQKGHEEAKYMYGVILLCSKDDELRKEGLDHMRFLRKSKCNIRCREKVKRLTKYMWRNNKMLVRNHNPLCQWKNTCKGWAVKKGRWLLQDYEDDDIELCEYCCNVPSAAG